MKLKRKIMKIKELRRQGDVMIGAVDEIPADAIERKRDGPIVLAFGESTGHKHAIYGGTTKEYCYGLYVFIDFNEIVEPLTHEEHGPLTPMKSPHIVIRQVEYTPKAIRNVAD